LAEKPTQQIPVHGDAAKKKEQAFSANSPLGQIAGRL
jgi:hypothetical protein